MAGTGGSPAERLGLIPASMVAGQAFCEYKVHLETLRGGMARSAGLARRITRRVVIRDRRGVLARASVLGEVLGVPVAASPDFVVLGSDGSIHGVGRSASGGRSGYLSLTSCILGSPASWCGGVAMEAGLSW